MSKSDEPAYRITDHARQEAERRSISSDLLQGVIESPGQIIEAYGNRKAYQSKVEIDGNPYLIRAIVENSNPLTVVTVYLTSKIKKYWSEES